MDESELTRIFTELGAPDPEGWAHSAATEGIAQLARYIFLRGGWDSILDDGDASWIDRCVNAIPAESTQPYAGIAHALRRLLAAGAAPADLTDLVRGMQAEMLFSFCYLLSDPSAAPGNDYVSWGLFELDEDDEPVREIGMLHESVLETDPTGREMRPA